MHCNSNSKKKHQVRFFKHASPFRDVQSDLEGNEKFLRLIIFWTIKIIVVYQLVATNSFIFRKDPLERTLPNAFFKIKIDNIEMKNLTQVRSSPVRKINLKIVDNSVKPTASAIRDYTLAPNNCSINHPYKKTLFIGALLSEGGKHPRLDK